MSIPVGRSEDSDSQKWRYDVFLSFRSEDTRRSFTSHLYLTLKDKGVNVFIDDDRLRRSGDISSETIRAIQSSRFSIIVFSRNYADSILCLQELSEIINCRKTLGHTVLPVFYNVDPSHVRNQRGSFGEAFARHEERMVSDKGRATIARWRAALTATGNLSGWDLTNLAKGSEAMIIREIARQIWVELKHTYLDVPKFLVGLNSRLNDMNLLLNDGSDAVCFVGICGMGGIGKTTLAKQVYNQFFHNFEAKSFLGNVRENSERPNDLVRLQEQLLRDILKEDKIKLMDVNRGVTMIKQRIHSNRVLIVLDDVDHANQLKSLARDRSWFGPGSRIIITTRNVDLLKEIEVDHVYMLEKLNGSESLQLFNWHAFQNHPHSEEFAALSHQITSYCMGLPLALQVLGCFLRDRTVVEWRSALEKLKRSPNGDIQKQLKISFDGLDDNDEKEIFLNIACFFVGWGKEHTVKILHGCGLSAEIGVSILCERFLVEFDVHNNTLMMHDLVRDMGREIVRKESPMNPGKRSRLWLHTDILSMLRNKRGTNKVEGLRLNPPEKQEVSSESFTGMSQLKLLQLNNVHVSIGKHSLLSQELRWVSWHNFPLKVIPKEFYMGNMVSVDMQYSKLEAAWQSTEILKNLKVLNLSHSHSLTKTPNFLQVPNLEELILEDCVELKEVHESIGHLQGLVLLNLQNCKKLKNLPDRICSIKSFQILDISGCFNIKKLPDNFGEMESMVKFIAHGTSIEYVPPSISRLKSLTELSLYNHRTSSSLVASLWSRIFARESPKGNSHLITSLEGLTLLKSLSLMGCNLQDGSIPASFKNLQFLEDLYLAENDFRYLPDSMSKLSNLSYVRMDDCPNLVSLPAMPPSLCYLNTSNCKSLESISLQEVGCAVLCSPNCPKLYEVSGLGNWTMDGSVQFVGCKNLSTKFQDFLLKDWQCGKYAEFVLPGSEIPCWFDYESQSSSLSFRLPSCQSCKVKVVTVCVLGAYYRKSILFPDKNSQIRFCPGITVHSKIRTFRFSIIAHHEYDKAALMEDHMVGFHLSHREIIEEKDFEFEVTVNPGRDWLVKRVGVYFRRELCEDCRIREEMISDTTGIEIQPGEAKSKKILFYDTEDDRQHKRRRSE